MNRRLPERLLPLAAVGVLLVLGLIALLGPADAPEPPLPQALLDSLRARLEAGEAQGYVGLLQQADSRVLLNLQLMDRDGGLLAEWPPALTRSGWGAFAPALQQLRRALWGLAGRRETRMLRGADGAPLGELSLIRLRGGAALASGRIGGLALSLLALAALWSLLGRMPRAAALPVGLPLRRGAGSVERIGLRMGAALDQADLGLILLNAGQKIRYINQTAAAQCGWDRQAALNLPVYSVLRLRGSDSNPFSFEGQQPLSERLSLSLSTRQGGTLDVSVTILRLRGRGDDWTGMLILLDAADHETQTLASLRREAELATTTLDALSDGVAVTDRFGRILRVNRRLNRLFAYADGELEGLAVSKLLPVPFLNEPSVTLAHFLGERQDGRPRVVGWRKNATTFPVDLRVQELGDEPYHYLLLISDCGERLRQDNLSMRLGRLLDYAAEEIYIFDAHSLYFVEANREAQENLGLSMEQLGRMTPLHLAPGLDRDQLDRDLNALRNGERRQVTYRTDHRRANGSSYPVSLRISYSPEEEPPVFMALAQDITEQRAAEMRLEFMAHNDVLTQLPNRAALTAHLDRMLQQENTSGEIHVYFLDLDDFKSINDSHGHAAGDAVLVEFTRRIRSCLPDEHFLSRMSGDEFVIVARVQASESVETTAAEFLRVMREPFRLQQADLQIGVCIGIARRQSGEDAAHLLQRADAAMYRAKARGGQCFVMDAGQGEAGFGPMSGAADRARTGG